MPAGGLVPGKEDDVTADVYRMHALGMTLRHAPAGSPAHEAALAEWNKLAPTYYAEVAAETRRGRCCSSTP